MTTVADTDAIKTINTHYIDGAFVRSHGHEVMDIIRPTDGRVIARVTLADEDDTRRAIGAAKRAFAMFGRTPKDERASILRRLHQAVAARVDDLTAAMVEEYGGVVQFARPHRGDGNQCVSGGREGRSRIAVDRKLGQDDRHPGAGGRGRPDYRVERQRAVHLSQAGIRRGRRLYGRHQAE
jgi:hypothetical protein